ncbi:hypothetical protein LUZ60_013406 [Juncus effusus]|nr:hypothetical protein LUZ60_013406 [Juncus effusus]
MRLQGSFPSGLEMCEGLTNLYLSGNKFSGPIPNLSLMVPYLTTLDLSFNLFSGEIPADFSSCIYLNSLNLQHNNLTGQIPNEITRLQRLKFFNVSFNQLSSQIPERFANFSSDDFSGNSGLCGKPLKDCLLSLSKKNLDTGEVVASTLGVIIGFSIGIIVSSQIDLENPRIAWAFYCIVVKNSWLTFSEYVLKFFKRKA